MANISLGLPASWDPKFLTLYVLGLIIIILYAKDKFNLPTYDRDAMGPFAQLPPQFLTVDSRYRHGRLIYLGLMIGLYTALCIVGPTTFSSLELTGASIQLGPTGSSTKNAEIWPVAAATFLISTVAAKDTSMLGRIELFIRQYAHRAAYIPSAVSDLAFSLRNFDIRQWLISNPYVDQNEFAERQAAISELAGPQALAKIMENPDQESELATWIRSNILFYTLQQIFAKRKIFSNAKLDYLTDVAENRENYERIQTDRAAIAAKVAGESQTAAFEKVYPEVQRLIKNTSLTLAVLLSQAARNANYLGGHLNQLGFQGVDLRDRSDHFVYTSFVNIFIVLAAGLSLLGVLLLVVFPPHLTWDQTFPALISVGIGTLSYLVLFRVLDYSRDRLLESLDWQESLVGYLKAIVPAAIIASIVCMVLTILLFFPFDSLKAYLSPLAITQLLAFQFIVTGLGAVFGIQYTRNAARMPAQLLKLSNPAVTRLPLIHALCAATLIGGLNYLINNYNVENAPQSTINSIRGTVVYLRNNLKDPSGGPKEISGGEGWFSGKNVKDIDQLLGYIESGLTKAGTYWISMRGAPITDIRKKQQEAIMKSCGELSKYVVEQINFTPYFNNDRCMLGEDLEPKDSGDRRFMGLVSDLSALIQMLGPPQPFGVEDYMASLFPAITAFFFALMYGVGLTYWRGWWLYNEKNRENGQIAKLKEQVKKAFDASIDFDKWLINPLPSLSLLTPIEAVRYEDYRIKLFADVRKRKAELCHCLLDMDPGGNAPDAGVQGPKMEEAA